MCAAWTTSGATAWLAARGVQGDEQVLDAQDLRRCSGVVGGEALAVSRAARPVAAASDARGELLADRLADHAAEQALKALGAASVSVSRWEVGGEILRTLVNAGRLAPGETRHPTGEIYRLSGDDPLEAAAARRAPTSGVRRRPRAAPARALAARAARHALVRGGADHARRRRLGRAVGDPRRRGRSTSTTCGCSARSPARSRQAWRRAELFGRLSTLASEDELTGLANRARAGGAAGGRFDRLDERGGRGDAAAVRRRQPQAAQRHARPPRRRLGAEGGGDRAAPRGRGAAGRAGVPAQRRRVRHRWPRAPGAESSSASWRGGDRPPRRRTGRRSACRAASPPRGSGARTRVRAARAPPTRALYAAKRAGRGARLRRRRRPRPTRPLDGRPGARRARRDGLEVDTGTLIAQGLALLDGALRAAAPLERLEGLATSLGVDAAGRGGRGLAVRARRRLGRDAVQARPPLRATRSGVRQGMDGDALRARRLPAHRRAAGRRRLAPRLRGRRRTPTPPSARILERLGVTDVLLAAAADGRGAWLLEIYGDAELGRPRAGRRRAAAAVRPRGAGRRAGCARSAARRRSLRAVQPAGAGCARASRGPSRP